MNTFFYIFFLISDFQRVVTWGKMVVGKRKKRKLNAQVSNFLASALKSIFFTNNPYLHYQKTLNTVKKIKKNLKNFFLFFNFFNISTKLYSRQKNLFVFFCWQNFLISISLWINLKKN
ncbi:hypothetical protein NQ318_013482 [Aromia moschata]|uniref:Ribosomal protein L20 n=1 Tax=Aromia moschata TaxID=1265417 RepID=A0AAV8YB22_9CUCU|nr:hypothetical protein NQ318_013482 [Aromia moschata]